MQLTETEKIALSAVNERHADMTRRILTDVEARLGLPRGSVGRTHTVDENGNVVMRPETRTHFERLMAEQPPNGAVPNVPPESAGERRDVDPGTP